MTARTITSSSGSSSLPSPLSRRGSASSNRSASSAEPVIRGGFVIPSITLTPPDARHSRSQPLPWQDFTSKTTLYVPVKTEEIGWEEGGLWWCGKFNYREVALYGGQDNHVVGKYRGGPDGYSYMEVWDQDAFEGREATRPKQNNEPAPQKVSNNKKTSAEERRGSESEERVSPSSSSSTSPPKPAETGSVSTAVSSTGASTLLQTAVSFAPDHNGTPSSSRRSSTSSCPSLSSTPSSRRSSDSTNEEDIKLDTPTDSPLRGTSFSNLVATSLGKGKAAESLIVQSPTSCLDPSGGEAPFAKLEAVLLALKAEKKAQDAEDSCAEQSGVEPAEEFTPRQRASPCPASPASPPASSLKPGRSLLLSEDGPSASHRWPKGRGVARIAPRSDASKRFGTTQAEQQEQELGFSY